MTGQTIRRFNYFLSETNSAYHEAAVKLGVSDSVIQVLYAVCDQGDGCLLKQIVKLTGVSKQTLNSALRKMEEEGLLYLQQADAKKKTVHLTEKGRELADRSARLVWNMEDDIFNAWSKEDREKYLELTERFLREFRKKTALLSVSTENAGKRGKRIQTGERTAEQPTEQTGEQQ